MLRNPTLLSSGRLMHLQSALPTLTRLLARGPKPTQTSPLASPLRLLYHAALRATLLTRSPTSRDAPCSNANVDTSKSNKN